jgi:hypothetical protein
MNSIDKIKIILTEIQPLYDKLNSKYSKSYLQGSLWYVGDDLSEWWRKCNNVRYYEENINKIMIIIEIINDMKTKL